MKIAICTRALSLILLFSIPFHATGRSVRLLTDELPKSGASDDAKTAKGTLKIVAKVDQRVELMSIVARLAGYEEYVNDFLKTYCNDVDRYFEKYKGHPVVQFARQIRVSNEIGFDAVMKMAVHLAPAPSLKPRVAFSDKVPDPRWGKDAAERFAILLRQFYIDADCARFFLLHARLYNTVEQRIQAVLDKIDLDWFERFYGEGAKSRFNLYIGLLNGAGSYGPKVVYPDNSEDLYSIIGAWQMDKDGLPLFDETLVPYIVHEYSHSFINHLISEREDRLSSVGPKIFGPVAERMKSRAYATWQTMIIESLVRSAVIRYIFEHEKELSTSYQELTAERNLGFLWIGDLFTLLGTYENSRVTYPTFRSFIPLIEAYFEDLSKRIDFEAKRFDELLPNVESIAPFPNGSLNVDPTITQLTITFDRPLDPHAGWSINRGAGGGEHDPVDRVIGFNETGSAITIQVKLKPDWDYEFVLTGLSFRTKDGYPLRSYSIKFRTK